MSDPINNKSGQIKTHLAEYVKTFTEYDGSSRPVRIITARHDAGPGEVAVCAQYSYDAASSRVTFMLEYEVAWDVSWDLAAFPLGALNTGRT